MAKQRADDAGTVDPVAVGRRIQQARAEAGQMTQTRLGQHVGVSMRSVRAWEKGDVVPYRHLDRLALVLGRTRNWLLHGHDEAAAGADAAERVEAAHAALRSSVEAMNRQLEQLREQLAERDARILALLRHEVPLELGGIDALVETTPPPRARRKTA